MSRFRLLVSEALNSIRANVSTTVAATMTVFIGMFLLGICIALGSWMVSWSDHTKKEITVNVFFCTPETCDKDVTSKEKAATYTRIKAITAQGMIKKAVYVPKKVAYKQQSSQYKDIYHALGSYNPLPDSFKIIPTRGEDAGKIAHLLQNPPLKGVEKITYNEKVANRVIHVARVIEISFLVMVIILLIASTALIANTIRLSIFSRRREIEVMKLVGATNWFVRGPFMIEGLICGFGGALAAVILFAVTRAVASSLLSTGFTSSGGDVHAWPFAVTSLLIIATGLVLGALGTGITLRRFLKI